MSEKTIAVLSRTNAGLRPYEDALSSAGVRYHLIGGSGFWASSEIRSVLAYLGCVLYPADYLLAGAIHAPFWPAKFLPKTRLLAALKKEKEKLGTSYWQALNTSPATLVDNKNLGAVHEFTQFVYSLSRYRNMSAAEALKSVMGALKVGDYFAEFESIDNDPLSNLNELIKLSGKWTDVKSFLDYTRRASAASKGRRGVMLSTIHSFKGMEAHTVFVVGCQEGQLPHSKATDIQEELNLFFVACSRPERELYITYTGVPSLFLKKNG